MCSEVDGDGCQIWHKREVKARKEHVCYECGCPIFRTQVHTRITSLYDGSWSSYRLHTDCLSARGFLAEDVCNAGGIILGGDEGLSIVADVMHHADEYPDRRDELIRLAEKLSKARVQEELQYGGTP